MECRTTARSILVTLETGQQTLIVQILMDCPACGVGQVQFVGHHLPAVKRIVDDAIAAYPDLTQAEDLRVISRETFTGTAGGNPEHN